MKKNKKIPMLTLGERMYTYEVVSRNKLVPKQPVILRIDCRNFRKLIKKHWNIVGEDHSIDPRICNAFVTATMKVCQNIENAEFAFYQRDEVIIFLKDYNNLYQTQYFGGDIQKLTSIVSSQFTYWFNSILHNDLVNTNFGVVYSAQEFEPVYFYTVAYNVPLFEVINNFIFKQQESLRRYKRSVYSKGIAFYKKSIEYIDEIHKVTVERNKWVSDINPPIFSKDKSLIENIVLK